MLQEALKEADIKLLNNRSNHDKARTEFLEFEQRIKLDFHGREKLATKPAPVKLRAAMDSPSRLNPALTEKEHMINQLIKYQMNFEEPSGVTRSLNCMVSCLAAVA